jgi:hypothetical protein
MLYHLYTNSLYNDNRYIKIIIGKNVVAANVWYSVDVGTGGGIPAQKRLTKRRNHHCGTLEFRKK